MGQEMAQNVGVALTESFAINAQFTTHNIYPGNNMCQKCGRKSGLWVLHEIVNKTYAENMKKIVGAVWELPAK